MNMNRRKFITTTALALPSVAVFGAISTQSKSYRSVTSLFSNEEMTEWCNKNGMYYVRNSVGDSVHYSVEDSVRDKLKTYDFTTQNKY